MEENASDFRLFRENVKNALLSISEHDRFTKGLFAWIGFRTEYIEYQVQKREIGNSKWTLKMLLRYAFGGITSFSNVPLLFSLYLGMLVCLVSAVFFVIHLVGSHSIVPDLLFLLSGLLFVCLGITGFYLAKIYTDVKKRPIYVIKEKSGNV